MPAIQLEEVVPINISRAGAKSEKEARPLLEVNKEEFTKEEKRKERAHRKRQIKAHLKAKDV